MTNINDLNKYIKKTLNDHPVHTEEINSLYELCLSEIEDDCTSVTHEINLCINDIEYIINNK
jgi:hypothetical protein